MKRQVQDNPSSKKEKCHQTVKSAESKNSVKKEEIVNKNYKDGAFRLIFKEKEELLSLYNALRGTEYGPETEIRIETLEDAIFIERKNDLAFSIEDQLVMLIEQQSTVNENMPFRMLEYIAAILERWRPSKMSIYRKSRIPLPTPTFIVLYNGKEQMPAETTMKLSDAYKCKGSEIDLELTVHVYNINYGKNDALLNKCKTLKEYSFFVQIVR